MFGQLVVTLLFRACLAAVVRDTSAVTPSTVYQFSSSIVPENSLLRPNGQLLVVANSATKVYQLNPNLTSSQPLNVVYSFPGVTLVFGIVEVATDPPGYDSGKVVAKQVITPVKTVSNFDGLAILNATAGLLAASDETSGRIWTLDIHHNTVASLLSSPKLRGVSDSTFNQIGVNGLKIRGNQLYCTVTGMDYLGVVQVDTSTGEATGSLAVVFNYGEHLDDFNIVPSGNIYLSTLDTNPGGGLLRRAAGTANGQNGTSLVVSEYGTNAAIFQQSSSSSCTLIFLAGLANRVSKATISGAC
ncbi:hypothetical protein PRZ48_013475 [Zasmidium cellare]|uniref:Six-bladed beta-propeller-like protein n=1 Tax=Zasmidium cellare TaxID=395010 RepID=A0ABR0E1X4_ZASCE|nr:hypothetical protein PRZ48_013475 [Zasmidium cellare]